MGTPEFPDLGKHCSVEDCKLIDFLPFTCDRCKKVYCLEHRGYGKHSCPNADHQDVTVVICPLCAKGVRLIHDEDANITWERHVNTDCDPSNFEKRTKKKKCPVQGCRETLVFSNTIQCRDCKQDHCLKHRFGPDHHCPGPVKQETGFMAHFRGNKKGNPATLDQNSSSWWSSIRASAEASFSKLSNTTSQQRQKMKGTTPSSSSNQLTENCVHCPQRFSSVAALIEHVERIHLGGVPGRHTKMEIDACPKCSKGFVDPVMLVQHIEKEHGGNSSRKK